MLFFLLSISSGMIIYSITHFVWFSNNDLTSYRKQHHLLTGSNIKSNRPSPAAPTCELPTETWSFLFCDSFRGIRQIELCYPLAGRVLISRNMVFCLLLVRSYGCCMQRPTPESQKSLSRLGFTFLPSLWEQECIYLSTPDTCPTPDTYLHCAFPVRLKTRYPVNSWASLIVLFLR